MFVGQYKEYHCFEMLFYLSVLPMSWWIYSLMGRGMLQNPTGWIHKVATRFWGRALDVAVTGGAMSYSTLPGRLATCD